MFKINFLSAITLYLCFSIFLVFTIWIFYNFRRNNIHNETTHLKQCPYCTYLFFDYTSRITPAKEIETRGVVGEEAKEQASATEENQDKDDCFIICPRCRSYIKREGE